MSLPPKRRKKDETRAMIARVKRELKSKTDGEIKNFDPILTLCLIGYGLFEDPTTGEVLAPSIQDRINIFKEVSRYWHPQRKAVEIVAENEDSWRHIDDVPSEDLQGIVIQALRTGKLDEELSEAVMDMIPSPTNRCQ